jgi:hypothetical protein
MLARSRSMVALVSRPRRVGLWSDPLIGLSYRPGRGCGGLAAADLARRQQSAAA